ncbi:MAG TPA: phosphoribosylformylglycinamidine synthase subunit PurS, partial [Chloroflexota bacterium]
ARVHVYLKPIVNDPQGEAILGGLKTLGFASVSQVRAGKYLEVHLESASATDAQRLAEDMCRRLLANPVLEDFRISVEELT